MRYRPEPEWREKNWTSNVFRVWEAIFGRENKVKIESAANSWIDKDGNRGETFIAYSLEAKIAFFEQFIRRYVSSVINKLKRIRLPDFDIFDVLTPQYALVGFQVIPKTGKYPTGYLFAIALDTSGSAVTSVTSTVTVTSYTVTGSNVMMLVAATDQANCTTNWATNVTGITANAAALSKITIANGDVTLGVYGQNAGIWSKAAPASGNVVGTRTATTDGFQIGVETLSGVDQSLTGSSIANNLQNNGTTIVGDTTSPAVTAPTNGWVAMSVYIATGTPATASTGTILRQSASAFGYLFDSNGLVSGSQSLVFHETVTVSFGIAICAVGPVAQTVSTHNLSLLGAGT